MIRPRLTGKPRLILAAVVVLALLAGSIWLLLRPHSAAANTLTASGTIEAHIVDVAPEISGRVVSVAVEEGAAVTAGQTLLVLDDAALKAQQASAQASLDLAQANYDLLTAAPTDESVRQAQAAVDAAQAQLDSLEAGPRQEQVTQAEANLSIAQAKLASLERGGRPEQIAQAQANLTAAQAQYDLVAQGPTDDDIALAKLAVDQAKNALWAAQASRDGICGNKHNADYLCDAADAQAAAAETAVQQAQEKLAQLQAGSSEEAIAQAKSAVDAAQAQLELAQQPASSEDLAQAQDAVRLAEAQLALAKDPVTTHDLAAAAAQVAAAQAQYDALMAGARPEQVAASQAQVDLAQAQLEASNVQLAKATITTPLDGQILTRSVEPGEIVAASSPLFVIGNLQSLEITVYLPEEEYARVTVGDTAELTVDPYPSRVFTATITHIADEAEFTPRSVQTEEGRKDTVFAVRLSIANPDLALKPGLPADVTFKPDR